MSDLARRTLMQLPFAAALGAQSTAPKAPELELVGKLKPRPSGSIKASPLSVGFECLDRRLFEPEKTYAHLGALGVKWARVQTGWSRCEREKGRFDFQWLDSIVDSVLKSGVQPWFNVGYGNKLYSPESPQESAVGWAPLYTAEARDAWVRFVGELTAHFRGRVKHWEIWNEPNITVFWKPKAPNPAEYTDLVKLTSPVIRRRIPDATIIGGAMSSDAGQFEWLTRCFELGMGQLVDRISFHRYRWSPELNYESNVRALRALVKRYKSSLELWQGECGVPSEKGGVGALAGMDWSEPRQARWLLRRVLLDMKLELELSSYFHLTDLTNYTEGTVQKGKSAFFGLLRANSYEPKPSYYAYQNLCSLFDSETKRADLVFDVTTPAKPGVAEAVLLRNLRSTRTSRLRLLVSIRSARIFCTCHSVGRVLERVRDFSLGPRAGRSPERPDL